MPPRGQSTLTFREKIGELDIPGALLLVPGITCLLLALQWGGSEYAWSVSKVWGSLLGFGLIITCFVILQISRGEKYSLPSPTLIIQ